MSNTNTHNWTEILEHVLSTPGKLSEAYRMLHSYSIGNVCAAIWQCAARGIAFGPIATYKRWAELGRQVKKGQKAISLAMPVTIKEKKSEAESVADAPEEKKKMVFVWRNLWFVMAQTEGPQVPEYASTPEWNPRTMLETLEITEVPHSDADGSLGYAEMRARRVAVVVVNPYPVRTLIHEVAHVLLHQRRNQSTNTMEFEAEAVAVIVCETLGLPYDAASSRAYIQHYWGVEAITETTARRIFSTADQIIKAGAAKAAPLEEAA